MGGARMAGAARADAAVEESLSGKLEVAGWLGRIEHPKRCHVGGYP